MGTNRVIKSFSLSEEEVKRFESYKIMNGFKKDSDFLKYLINELVDRADPLKEMESLKDNILQKEKELIILKESEQKAYQRFKSLEEWRKIKQQEKPKIIAGIVRMILQGRNSDAEECAEKSATRLGMKKEELLMEAVKEVKRGI